MTMLFKINIHNLMVYLQVKAWLHGMSTLNRTSDVSIFFHETYRTIQCPFSLGPLELKVSKRTTGKYRQQHLVWRKCIKKLFKLMELLEIVKLQF